MWYNKEIKKEQILNKILLTTLITLSVSAGVLVYTGFQKRQKPQLLSRAAFPSPILIPTVFLIPSPIIPTSTPLPTASPTLMPEPTSTPIPLPPNEFESYFDQYSNQYKVDKDLLKKIANCESHINPGSVNGDYAGMYQFASTTWIATRGQMGLDMDTQLRFNAEEAIKTAAFKIGNGGASAWTNCL